MDYRVIRYSPSETLMVLNTSPNVIAFIFSSYTYRSKGFTINHHHRHRNNNNKYIGTILCNTTPIILNQSPNPIFSDMTY